MARKRNPRRTKRYAGKTEEEWRDWGEEFGKQMGKMGEELGRHMERRGREWKREYRYRCWPFGILGPLMGSIFSIAFLMIGVWLLNFINVFRINFVLLLTNVIFTNIHLFFVAFLFFGYAGYLSKWYEKSYWIISPIVSSASVVFSLWIATLVINLINLYVGISALSFVSNFLYANLYSFFFLFLVLFYAIIIINKMEEEKKWKK